MTTSTRIDINLLLVAFWQMVAEDIQGVNGDTLQLEAVRFVESKEFTHWADLSGINPDVLRRKFHLLMERSSLSSQPNPLPILQ